MPVSRPAGHVLQKLSGIKKKKTCSWMGRYDGVMERVGREGAKMRLVKEVSLVVMQNLIARAIQHELYPIIPTLHIRAEIRLFNITFHIEEPCRSITWLR